LENFRLNPLYNCKKRNYSSLNKPKGENLEKSENVDNENNKNQQDGGKNERAEIYFLGKELKDKKSNSNKKDKAKNSNLEKVSQKMDKIKTMKNNDLKYKENLAKFRNCSVINPEKNNSLSYNIKMLKAKIKESLFKNLLAHDYNNVKSKYMDYKKETNSTIYTDMSGCNTQYTQKFQNKKNIRSKVYSLDMRRKITDLNDFSNTFNFNNDNDSNGMKTSYYNTENLENIRNTLRNFRLQANNVRSN